MAKKTTYRVVRRTRHDADDTGSWSEVAMIPFRLVWLILSGPGVWILGFALGLCLAPFLIAAMAFKVLAVGALLSAFIRPRS